MASETTAGTATETTADTAAGTAADTGAGTAAEAVPVAPSGVSSSGSRARTVGQLVRYTLIGGSGVLLDMLAFLLLHNSAGMHEQLANALSTTIGITNNFVLNARITFDRRDRIVVRFLRFYAVGMTGILLTNLLFLLFTDSLGIDANLVKAGSLPLVLALQFVLNRKWSFA